MHARLPISTESLGRAGRLLADARSLARLGGSRWQSAKIAACYLGMPLKRRLPWLHSKAITLRIEFAGVRRTVIVSDASEMLTLKELLLEHEYELSGLGNPRVVLDLGANIGIATLMFRVRYPHARVVAVEPDPRTFEKLVRNVSADPRVITVNAAVTADPGEVAFVSDPMSWASRLAQPGEQGARSLPGVTLDELADRYGVGEGDLIKIDIEGAEHIVLPGASCLSRVATLIGEVHPTQPGAEERLFAELERRGWRHLRPLRRRLFAMVNDGPLAVDERPAHLGAGSG